MWWAKWAIVSRRALTFAYAEDLAKSGRKREGMVLTYREGRQRSVGGRSAAVGNSSVFQIDVFGDSGCCATQRQQRSRSAHGETETPIGKRQCSLSEEELV